MSRTALAEALAAAVGERRIISGNGVLERTAVERWVAALTKSGVRPREGVGLCIENGPDCLAAYAALAELDCVAVPLPPALPEAERLRLWARLDCRLALEAKGPRVLEGKGSAQWPRDVHWVMHSSGSTGIPKAIPLTETAVRRNAADVLAILDCKPKALHLGSMSQCYTNGLFNSFLLPVLTGASCVAGPVATALRLRDYTKLIRELKPEVLWVNPTVLVMLRREVGSRDLLPDAVLVSCTAPLNRQACLEAEAALGRKALQSYGLTETLIVSVEKPSRDAAQEFSAGVVAGDSGAVTIEKDGTLVIANGAVTPGYARLVEGRLEFSLPDGGIGGRLFVSSDLARLSPDGRLDIVGRVSNMINVEGVKVSAEQLEETLRDDPNVVESAVVPGQDAQGRERPVALVQVRGPVDAEGLMAECVRRLGPKARPAAVHVVDAIPRTGTGKVDRLEAARRFSELLRC